MKILLLLIGLVIVALLVTRQIAAPPAVERADSSATPVLPTTPSEVDEFAIEMEDFMQESAERRQREMEDQTR